MDSSCSEQPVTQTRPEAYREGYNTFHQGQPRRQKFQTCKEEHEYMEGWKKAQAEHQYPRDKIPTGPIIGPGAKVFVNGEYLGETVDSRQGCNTPEPVYGTELAYVRWIDSAIYEGENFTIEDLDGKELDMQSCGILVKEDPDRVTLALDHSPDNGNYRCLLTIPTVCIKFLKRFQV